jgi:hypothetical protein
MKVTLFIFMVVLLSACVPYIQSPITVVQIHQASDTEGKTTCQLYIKTYGNGGAPILTTYSPDNCQYKVGDILK